MCVFVFKNSNFCVIKDVIDSDALLQWSNLICYLKVGFTLCIDTIS